jgi:hypothetical protein
LNDYFLVQVVNPTTYKSKTNVHLEFGFLAVTGRRLIVIEEEDILGDNFSLRSFSYEDLKEVMLDKKLDGLFSLSTSSQTVFILCHSNETLQDILQHVETGRGRARAQVNCSH